MNRRKPYCQNCANNQQPICEVLRVEFADAAAVLEIGSGTGQHAVYFGARLPHLVWHTSDLPAQHAGIEGWLDEAALANVRPPLTLDVAGAWPDLDIDAVYSANTAHIMSWGGVCAMFDGAGQRLPDGARFALYGPFSYGGVHTSDGNARFDDALRAMDPACGLRDFDDLDALAVECGFALRGDHAMPANNRLLVWERGRSQAQPG